MSAEKWRLQTRETPFGLRWDVTTPFDFKGKTLWLVSGLCGDDGHKSKASAVRHAEKKYGQALTKSGRRG